MVIESSEQHVFVWLAKLAAQIYYMDIQGHLETSSQVTCMFRYVDLWLHDLF